MSNDIDRLRGNNNCDRVYYIVQILGILLDWEYRDYMTECIMHSAFRYSDMHYWITMALMLGIYFDTIL